MSLIWFYCFRNISMIDTIGPKYFLEMKYGKYHWLGIRCYRVMGFYYWDISSYTRDGNFWHVLLVYSLWALTTRRIWLTFSIEQVHIYEYKTVVFVLRSLIVVTNNKYFKGKICKHNITNASACVKIIENFRKCFNV